MSGLWSYNSSVGLVKALNYTNILKKILNKTPTVKKCGFFIHKSIKS